MTELRILSPYYHDMIQQSTARAARIDKLGVDRSRLNSMPMQRWSTDAEAAEQKWGEFRANITVAQRMAAWRTLFRRYAR